MSKYNIGTKTKLREHNMGWKTKLWKPQWWNQYQNTKMKPRPRQDKGK